MKKIIIILNSISILLILLGSCDDFLTKELKGDYTSDTYFINESAAVMSVTSIYNSLYDSKIWVFGDVASDDAVKGGNAGDQADINKIDEFTAKADNGMIATFWQYSYETISRANNCIEYIPPMSSVKDELKNRLVGEAKFLRAYSYFNLINVFGKVPLKLFPQNRASSIHVELSEVNVIYAQIEKDLKDAIEVLPVSYSTEKGRVTKGAAYGLLAKASLFQKKYTECLTNIQSLEALGQYSLVKTYSNLFKRGAEDSSEVIFGLRYNSEASLGNNLNVWFSPSVEQGYYFNAPTQSYVDAFTEKTIIGDDDPRLDASIGRDGKPWFNGKIFSKSWSEATGYLVKKYDEDTVAKFTKDQSAVPYHYLRYADVLLMKAEALNETNKTDIAATEVNKVRARANLSPTTATAQTDIRAVIQNERRKELGFEFHRFFDIMRWGKNYAEAAFLKTAFKWVEPRYYFPIPQMEVDANQSI